MKPSSDEWEQIVEDRLDLADGENK